MAKQLNFNEKVLYLCVITINLEVIPLLSSSYKIEKIYELRIHLFRCAGSNVCSS